LRKKASDYLGGGWLKGTVVQLVVIFDESREIIFVMNKKEG
jgi:hypothetical protein